MLSGSPGMVFGLAGFSCFMFFLYKLWSMHLDNTRIGKDGELNGISKGLFIALVFYLGSSFFDSFLFKPHHTSFIIVVLWALAATIYQINHQNNNSAPVQGQTISGAGE